jgi:flagellar hook-associated protein 3 FlgL
MVTISTLGQSNLVRSQIATLQSGIQALQTQIGTGEKTQRYGDLGAQATLSISLRNQATLLDNYKNNINNLSIRTGMIDQSLSSINDTAVAVRNQAFASPSSPQQRLNMVAAAKSAIDQITQSLQISVDGRNLFGGTQTQSNPVTGSAMLLPNVQLAVTAAIASGLPTVPAAIQAAVQGTIGGTQITAQGDSATTSFPYAFNLPNAAAAVVTVVDSTTTPPTTRVLPSTQYSTTAPGSAPGGTLTLSGPPLTAGQYITISQLAPAPNSAAGYYLGGPPHAPTEVDQGLTVDYSLTAGDPAFVTLLAGLYTLAALPQPTGANATPPALSDSQFDAMATAASSTISQGLTQLQGLTEKNGRNEQFLTQESTAHDATLTLLQGQINDIEQVNLADASTRLTQLQTQLDASYHVVADLSSLNLVDFLK